MNDDAKPRIHWDEVAEFLRFFVILVGPAVIVAGIITGAMFIWLPLGIAVFLAVLVGSILLAYRH
jgi:hypothetical protein